MWHGTAIAQFVPVRFSLALSLCRVARTDPHINPATAVAYLAPTNLLPPWHHACLSVLCCAVKKNVHVIVPAANFTTLQGESYLTEYQVRLTWCRAQERRRCAQPHPVLLLQSQKSKTPVARAVWLKDSPTLSLQAVWSHALLHPQVCGRLHCTENILQMQPVLEPIARAGPIRMGMR